MKQRGRFSAAVAITRLRITYADGHTSEHLGQEAGAVAFSVGDPLRTNPISVMRILEAHHLATGGFLRAGGDEALSKAAKHGSATVNLTGRFPIEPIMKFPKAQRVVEFVAEYQVTISRVSDG